MAIRKLVNALKPFADEADTWWHKIDNRYHPGVSEPRSQSIAAKAEFSIGDLRRARKLFLEFKSWPS